MTNVLHYPGDKRATLEESDFFGPSQDGRFHRVTMAEYDPDQDRTTAYLEEADIRA